MAYMGNLAAGHQVYVDQQNDQTVVTLQSHTAGQQQSQTSSYPTGRWSSPPVLFRTQAGIILRIDGSGKPVFIAIQVGNLHLLNDAPPLGNADVLPLQQVESQQSSGFSSMPPMEPMKPMQPMERMKMGEMRMGDMAMNMNPMQMRMGNMELSMGSAASSSPQPSKTARFCSQCGEAIEESDRFCSHCGHRLK